jgi:hypothetical protein
LAQKTGLPRGVLAHRDVNRGVVELVQERQELVEPAGLSRHVGFADNLPAQHA